MAAKRRPFPSVGQKKKRTLQTENKKQLILKVATEIFAEKGFNEATISQIAQEAKIAEGSIYDYFKNKEDLLFSIPEERMEKFLSGLHEHLAGITGALPRLRKLIWYHLNFYEKNKDYVLILLQNIRQNPRFNSTRAYHLIREFGKLVNRIIEEGKTEGVIRPGIDSRLLRDALLGAIEHITIRGSILGRLPALTDAADLLYDFFVSGIHAQSGTVTMPLREFIEIEKSIPQKGRKAIRDRTKKFLRKS
ncbi:MAG: TetR/AcrR family transcriptional regulator [Deltaproteobacteria bacterium]|nr:TetR/AcrR family transcriptional regulator [Deltaproteobacteria bacterium]